MLIYWDNDDIYSKDEGLNMIICVENCDKWGWYHHYNKFGNYNSKKMSIYLYNHISKIEKTDKYIGIPLIYFRINYYMMNKDIIKPIEKTNYIDKKFCLVVNRSGLNNEINQITSMLNNISQVDNIDMYTNILINKSFN